MSTNPYDPVTTTDTTNLADDEWGLSLPGVRYHKNYYGRSRFKGLCRTIQDRPKLSALVFLLIVGVILLVVIVAVASGGGESKRHPTGKEPKWQAETEGLEFYPIPEDKTIVISFDVKAMGNDDPIKAVLDNMTKPYDSIDQLDETKYTDCNATFHPPDKTCRFGRAKFGPECSSQRDYGYRHALPCIFIQLNLPDGVMIKPITSASPLWEMVKPIMDKHDDPSWVPLKCQGTMDVDRSNIGAKGLDGAAIQYYPDNGFPSYFYRERNTSLPFLKPALMVRLTSLKDEQLVHVTCTAYGQLFYFNGTACDHDLLLLDFAVYVRH